MKIIKHVTVKHERLVVLAEPGEPGLCRLIDPDHLEYEGWTLDFYVGNKFVLVRESKDVQTPEL